MLPRSRDKAAEEVDLSVVFETIFLFYFRRNFSAVWKSEPDLWGKKKRKFVE